MFTVELLPAQQGDAIWIEYGSPATPHRILIDCGTPPTATLLRSRIEQLDPEQRNFELLVVTHIDADHIGGALRLLADLPSGTTFGDVWFNAWRHLAAVPSSRLGPIDGEILSTALDKRGWPWNAAFDGRAVSVDTNPDPVQLAGGMALTVLSPGDGELRKLRASWRSVVRAAGLDPRDPNRAARLLQKASHKGVGSSILGPRRADVQKLAATDFVGDASVANGSSIALLAEYEGRSCVLTGDGLPEVMLPAIQRLLARRNQARLHADALKVPHHGSRHNLSNAFAAAIQAQHFLFSTSGAVFGHPDAEAVARILVGNPLPGCHLYFNYPKDGGAPDWSARQWSDSRLKRTYRFEASFAGPAGTRLVLLAA